MAGDFSRSTLNRVKHYAGVLMQQGRVQVDADWNEQLALQLHRTWTETRDVIGRCGAPQCGSGFAISPSADGADLLIHPGRFYVNGLLCELDPQVVPAWLPSSASPPTRGIWRTPPSRNRFGTIRPIETQRVMNDRRRIEVHHRSGVVYIPSKNIDGRDLTPGDWVEIFADGGASVTARVENIDDATEPDDPNFLVPSYYPVLVDHSLDSLANAGQLSLRRLVTFTTQPFLLNQWDESVETSPNNGVASLNLPDGSYLVVLEAWQREINALEDPHIREVALGGPDTCERLQTVWQVHVLPWSGESSPPGSPLPSPLPSPPSPPGCCSDFPNFDDYKATTRTTGLMNAQAPSPGNNVPQCQLPPSAGYLGLANQLYRVEIFQPGYFNQAATFVWSRDNAMVETPVVCIDASGNVYVSSLGVDDLHSFSLNDWVEIVDDDADLQGESRFLTQISQPPASAAQPPCASTGVQGYQLTLQPSAPARFQNKANLRLRRWDMADNQVAFDSSGNPIGIPLAPGWTALENNIQVNFSDGYYAARSYWQIPARTATGDIEWPPFDVPNSNPIPQPPLGPDHFFCRLALLTVSGGNIQAEDCRCTFPSLNSICAQMEQALEQRDALHRLQNRSLHGTGVVCGLAVTCPGAGLSDTSVNVASGYAIDCDGYDLMLGQATPVDLASVIDLSPPSSPSSPPSPLHQGALPDGEYELLLERSGDATRVCDDPAFASPPCDPCCSEGATTAGISGVPVQFRAIPCEKDTFSNKILKGTLLNDFFTQCVQPMFDAFHAGWTKKFIAGSEQITEAQALLSALTDLFIEIAQPALTKDVYISASEAGRLKAFYNFVVGQITDCTYCSLTDSLPAFPDYPLSQPMNSLYGKGFMTRVRVSNNGKYAITCGKGPNLHIYELGSGLLSGVVTLPIPGDSSGWTVRDVTFLSDGTICAIAGGVNTQTNATDSLVAIGSIAGNTIHWTTHGSAGAHTYLTLAGIPPQLGVVYAAASGAGIFAISVIGGVNVTQIAQFNAIGHLVYYGEFLYATATALSQNGATTYEVLRFSPHAGAGALQNPELVCPLNNITVDLTDDLAVGRFSNDAGVQSTPAIFVSGYSTASTTKHLVLLGGKGEQVSDVNLNQNTTIRLAIHPYATTVLVSYEASSQLATVAGGANGLALTPYAPVELHPTALAFSHTQNDVFVYTLNSTANTISSMPADTPAFKDDVELGLYRVKAIHAFVTLFEAWLQYLKDCFCKLLLPACPTCDSNAPEGKGVALACITVKDGAVQKICNLEKRRIVKTFPTVGYWLSVIPIIPLIKDLVAEFCCLTLPGLFINSQLERMVAGSGPAQNKASNLSRFMPSIDLSSASGENFRYALSQVGKIDISSLPASLLKKFAPISKLTLDSFVSSLRPPSPTPAAVPIAHINGMSLDQAEAELQASKVQVVATESYDPSTFTQNIGNYIAAPTAVPPGSAVTLVVDSSNTVRYYVPTSPAVQQLGASLQTNQAAVEAQLNSATQIAQQLQTRVAAVESAEAPALQNIKSLQSTIGNLQTQIATMQTTHASELASRDQQIAQLTAATQQMQVKLNTVDTLTIQLQDIQRRLPPAPKG